MLQRSLQLESIFKANPIRSWSDISSQFGDTFQALDGVTTFNRGKGVLRKNRLPAILDDRQCIVGDLIPPTSWGSSLANLLTKSSWDKIRHPLLDEVNRVCTVCGKQHSTLDIHERWGYHFPVDDMKNLDSVPEGSLIFGVQRLEGFHAVCKSCHRCFHLGLANVRGELKEVQAIMKTVNQWSDEDMDRYMDVINERCETANQIHWALDLSYVSKYNLNVKSPWKFGEPDQQFLVGETQLGQSLTVILNAKWSFATPKPDANGIHYLSEQRFANNDAKRSEPSQK